MEKNKKTPLIKATTEEIKKEKGRVDIIIKPQTLTFFGGVK